MKRFLSLVLSVSVVIGAASNAAVITASAAENDAAVVRLDPSNASPFNNGSFQGWGTSLCWWANRMGYSPKLTKQAADAFFSDEGLGLDIARYNLGGGDDPTHDHITRSDSKVPTYAVPTLDSEGNLTKDSEGNYIWTYDWTADENQRNIAAAALAANPDLYFEGFSNSPPWFMTVSGCSSGASDAGNDNLSSEHFDEFGKYIADVTKHFKDSWGITFQSYSPMNEPDTTYWGAYSPKQEGAHYTPGATQSGTIVATRKALDDAGLTNVLVAGMDETDINKSVTNLGKLTDEAKTALGRVDTHTYNGNQRSQLKAKAVDMNKDLWMSEVDGGWDGFGLAERIILDMNGMQPAAWVMWDIVDRHKDADFSYEAEEDEKQSDGTTTKVTKTYYPEKNATLNATDSLWGVGMADHDTETLYLANKYYFFGQFTRYINPGDTIIASSDTTLAAYNKTTGDIKIVALNSSNSAKDYVFDLGAFTNVGDTLKEIRTDNATDANAEHWKEIDGEATLANKKITAPLKARSITTFVVSGSEGTSYIAVKGADRLAVGETADYTIDTNIDSQDDVSYSVSDDTIAEIDSSTGRLTAKNKGRVTVTATVGGLSGSRDVEVYFEITGASDKIKLGSTVQLSVGDALKDATVTWSSSNYEIATVTDKGAVTALKAGEVTITAVYNGNTAQKTFTVPSYTLTGTPSWGNATNAPKDSDDYTQVADGDFATFFDGTTGGWVRYDYGAPYTVTQIKLAPRTGYKSRTVGGKVQGSNDAITWTDLYDVTTALDESKYTTITASQLKSGKAFRYFRYTNSADMANISEFIVEGAPASDGTPAGEPVVTDIDEFTDDFEGSSNIFGASYGELSESNNTNTVFDSGLARFGRVFAPVKSTAKSELSEPLSLTAKQKFRLTFNMFAGWEDKGKENTFKINDKDGNELIAIYITGGGYTLQEIRVGGKNVLEKTAIAQSKSNAASSKTGANGWNVSDQPYRNNMGFNKTVEITADGAGNVTVSLTGGMEDASVTGSLTAPVTIGSIEATGSYNAAANRIVSYDNLDGDVITYTEDFEPLTPPEPTEAPVLPETGELISLDFDGGDLTSTSSYGKAEATGTAKFAEVDGKKCLQLDGTQTVIKLTDANGNPLLTGQKNLTISFKVKPSGADTSWWFFAAPNDDGQTYQKEKYLGGHTANGSLNVERYSNSGSRSAMASGVCAANVWSDVKIYVRDNSTALYINGKKAAEAASTVDISQMLGENSVAYIGKANWGTGEYASGYIDDFVIYNYAPPALDASRMGDTVRYTTGYTEGAPYTVYTALYDADGALVTVRTNQTDGTFTASQTDKNYTIKQFVWKGTEPYMEAESIVLKPTNGAYLFAHFVGTESNENEEQIYFSLSADGSTWKTINGGKPIFKSAVGEKGVRDPYILRGEDGKFFVIATDLSIYNRRGDNNRWTTCQRSGSKSIVIWESDDLVNWGEASLVKVAVDEAGCAWAPEAVYDSEKGQYMVFWASKVSTDDYAKQRMYRSYTSDFKTFTAPEVYIDNADSAIDTTILKEGDTYYRFTKDETHSAVTMMKSKSLSSGWEDVSTYTINGVAGDSVTGYEGPTIYKINGENKWCLLLDYYSASQGYKPFVTEDITKGVFTSASDFTFDATYRHGTVMPITAEEYNRLAEKFGI